MFQCVFLDWQVSLHSGSLVTAVYSPHFSSSSGSPLTLKLVSFPLQITDKMPASFKKALHKARANWLYGPTDKCHGHLACKRSLGKEHVDVCMSHSSARHRSVQCKCSYLQVQSSAVLHQRKNDITFILKVFFCSNIIDLFSIVCKRTSPQSLSYF